MSIKIGSFNMYKCSYEKNKEIAKEFDKIAKILCQFDIVALQEVINEYAVKSIVYYMGAHWDYRWAAPTSKSVQAQEGYAFIWNKNKFKLATGLREEERGLKSEQLDWHANQSYEARIESNYRPDQMLYQGRLVRDPMYARFESLHSFFEIRLINTHIMFSDSSPDGIISESNAIKRKREFQILANIYRQLASRVYRSNRPSYTFLLGDYNLNLPSSSARSPYVEPCITHTDRNGVQSQFITVQEDLTTLKRDLSPENRENVFSNNYDHFSFDAVRFDGIKWSCYAMNTVESICFGDASKHKVAISDHIPIVMDLSLNGH